MLIYQYKIDLKLVNLINLDKHNPKYLIDNISNLN